MLKCRIGVLVTTQSLHELKGLVNSQNTCFRKGAPYFTFVYTRALSGPSFRNKGLGLPEA